MRNGAIFVGLLAACVEASAKGFGSHGNASFAPVALIILVIAIIGA